MQKSKLNIILASPRGFCAGVDRAIRIVETAIKKYGKPVYVRHEIVHNRFVVEGLIEKGAIFVDELGQVPDDRPVVFSAHGVPKSVKEEASRRGLVWIDATCPLVGKVHTEAEKNFAAGNMTILIGHKGHPEVIGTTGQIPKDKIVVIGTEEEAEKLEIDDKKGIGYITQTTLSADETKKIINILERRFPTIHGPKKDDICFATTNRQKAVKAIAQKCDVLMVLGAPNSSNSKRLVEVAKANGCEKSLLVQRAKEVDWDKLKDIKTLGITAGASAPEILVKEVIDAANEHFEVNILEEIVASETLSFNLPKILAD